MRLTLPLFKLPYTAPLPNVNRNVISKLLRNATPEVLASIGTTYFMKRKKIETPILKIFITELTKLLPHMNSKDLRLSLMIKAIRYTADLRCRSEVMNFVKTIKNTDIITDNLFHLVQVTKMTEAYNIYDETLLNLVYDHTLIDPTHVRIKDIQYALTSLTNTSFKELILDETLKKRLDRLSNDIILESRFDADKQLFHLIPLLRAFVYYGYYNDDLVDYVDRKLADPISYDHMSKVIEFEKSLMLAYSAINIEGSRSLLNANMHILRAVCQNINRQGNLGNIRPDGSLEHLKFVMGSQSLLKNLRNSIQYRNISIALSSQAELQNRDYHFNFQYTLPHTNFADLVISLGEPTPGSFHEDTLLPRNVQPDCHPCILLAIRDSDYIDGYQRLCGYKRLIERLLRKLGYHVLLVNIFKSDIPCLAKKIHNHYQAAHRST